MVKTADAPAAPSAPAVSIPVTLPGERPAPPVQIPEPAPVAPPEEPKPEITSIPVSAAPQLPAAESAVITEPDAGTFKPTLPGMPETNFANVPKFGELQPKVDAHPLFSGEKERKVKIRRVPRFVKPLAVLIVLAAVGYLAIDAGAIRGASHLPYHVFKQDQTTDNTPLITQPQVSATTTPAATQETDEQSADPYADFKSYTLKYEKLSFKYPSAWTLKDTSVGNADELTLSGPDDFKMVISSAVPSHSSTDKTLPVVGAKLITFAGQSAYLDFVSTKNDKLVEAVTLSKSSNTTLDTFASKAIGKNKTAKGNLVVTASYTGLTPPKGASLTEATADANYKNAQLVIESMAYQ
jgi:hypothetical protein